MQRKSKLVLIPICAIGAGALGLSGLFPRMADSAIPAGSEPVPSPVYAAALLGANEAQAADTDGTGTATAVLNTTLNRVCYRIEVAAIALPATGAHIHVGPVGVNGPIVVDFAAPDASGVSEGCTTPRLGTTAGDIAANPAGYYFNVHTTEFPGGAVRGQLPAGLHPAGGLHVLAQPLRAYDSRDGAGRFGVETRTISLRTGRDGLGATRVAVPPGASSVTVTLTVTGNDGPSGFAKVYSNAVAEPATSSINWTGTNVDEANTVLSSIDALGRIKVTSSRATHLIVDVVAYTL